MTSESFLDKMELSSSLKTLKVINVENTLDHIIGVAKDVFDAEGGGIMFYESEANKLVLQYPAFGASKDIINKYQVSLYENGNATRVFCTGKGYLSNRVRGDPNINQYYAEMFGGEKVMTVPLEVGDQRIGVFHLVNKRQGNWREDDLWSFIKISSNLSIFIEGAREIKSLQDRQRRQYHLLESAIANNYDIQKIIDLLTEIVGYPVLLYDQFFNFIANSTLTEYESIIFSWKHLLEANCRLKKQVIMKTKHAPYHLVSFSGEESFPGSAWVMPVHSCNRTLGYLFFLELDPATKFDPLIGQEWGAVLALVLSHQRTLWKLREYLKAEFLQSLVSGKIVPEEAFFRASSLGLNLNQKMVFILVLPDNMTALQSCPKQEMLSNVLTEKIKYHLPGVWLGSLHNGIVILVPESTIFSCSVGSFIHETVHHLLKGISFSIGIGPVCCGPEDYPSAYVEARRAIEVGRILKGPGQVTESISLGSYGLLYNVSQLPNAQTFIQNVLGSLLAFDAEHGMELLDTLRIYLENGCNLRQAAQAAYIHVNTLRYRLSRIEEITGRSLTNAQHRFEFQLALQMMRVSKPQFDKPCEPQYTSLFTKM